MRVKKVIDSSGKIYLAIQRKQDWILLDKAIKEKGAESYLQFSDDIITFLESYKTEKEKIDDCIDSATENTFVSDDMKELMPFQPILYRDFLLCEKHYINCSRGMAKMFMPKIFPIVKIFEGVFKRPFPALKPKKNFYNNSIYYKGNHLSFVGSKTHVKYPEYATVKDYELELGVIITKEIYNATLDEALHAIGGFCVLNDFSARNMQIPEMSQTGPCKSKDFASAISNVVVTPDEVLPYLDTLE